MRLIYMPIVMLALCLFITMGCNKANTPDVKVATTPTTTTVTADTSLWSTTITYAKDGTVSWTVTLDGKTTLVDDKEVATRAAQSITPGTDMTPNDLRVYYAVGFTSTNFPKAYANKYCATYKIFKAYFDKQPDTYMLWLVTWQEGRGFDVPSKADAQAAGQLTPIC